MGEFLMPSLGADMEAGTLIEWEKKPGDPVQRGDVIAVVETQKGAIEIEVYQDGILDSYLVDIGRKVPVGTPLAVISDTGEAVSVPAAASSVDDAQDESDVTDQVSADADEDPGKLLATPPPETGPAIDGPHRRPRVSPAARRMAQNAGVDLAGTVGSGPGGAISMQDVSLLIEKPAQAHTADQSCVVSPQQDSKGSRAVDPGAVKIKAMRDAIAAAMTRSKREIPHYYLSHTIDLSAAQALMTQRNADRAPADRLVLGALYLKAVAVALARYPEFNGHYIDGSFQASTSVHAGMAINIRGGGLVAPAIHNTSELSLDELMHSMKDLVERVRAGRFRAAELSDPTITVSSLGERGVESLYAVIYPPQVAIIGLGSPLQKPFNIDGETEWRDTVVITLAADHRVSDGHRGALFLNAIRKLLESPGKL